MIDKDAVREQMSRGLAFTCAMCLKFWRARAAGHEQCEAAQLGLSCTGPMGGSTFQQYEGPLTPEARTRFCFRCGKEATKGLRFGACLTVVGVCDPHFAELAQWRKSKEPKGYRTLAERRGQFMER